MEYCGNCVHENNLSGGEQTPIRINFAPIVPDNRILLTMLRPNPLIEDYLPSSRMEAYWWADCEKPYAQNSNKGRPFEAVSNLHSK